MEGFCRIYRHISEARLPQDRHNIPRLVWPVAQDTVTYGLTVPADGPELGKGLRTTEAKYLRR